MTSRGGIGRVGGRGYGDICICIADSLCCTAETNTTLLSNYTPIKKKESGISKSTTSHTAGDAAVENNFLKRLLILQKADRKIEL